MVNLVGEASRSECRTVPVTLGEYGRTPYEGELVPGEAYVIDGIASTDPPCVSSLVRVAIACGDEEPIVSLSDTLHLVDAEVEHVGFNDRPCNYGCGTIGHHVFRAMGSDPSLLDDYDIPITFKTLDGMFGIVDPSMTE